MSFKIPRSLKEATRLTRAGKLSEATALIQQALGTGAPTPQKSPRKSAGADRMIDMKPVPASKAKRGAKSAGSRQSSTFTRHQHRGAKGSLEYLLYTPANLQPQAPLVLMLHGCSQSAEDFARGTGMNALADELGFLIAYPQQSSGANMQGCWNWFRPGDQRRDRGEPQMIAGITREVIESADADPRRVYVAGLSAGGAAAVIMAETHPDIYAACGVHSGLAHGAADSLASALSAMRAGSSSSASKSGVFVPVITFHGDRDTTVAGINSEQIIAAAGDRAPQPLNCDTSTGTSAGGRAFTRKLCTGPEGEIVIEQWTVHGAGHAWSGGDATGSYTDPSGPDASREMIRFFLQHRRPDAAIA